MDERALCFCCGKFWMVMESEAMRDVDFGVFCLILLLWPWKRAGAAVVAGSSFLVDDQHSRKVRHRFTTSPLHSLRQMAIATTFTSSLSSIHRIDRHGCHGTARHQIPGPQILRRTQFLF